MSVPRRILRTSHFRTAGVGSKRTVLSSSHRRSSLRCLIASKNKKSTKKVIGVSSEAAEFGRQIAMPRDGVLRAAASRSAKVRRSSKRIERFDRVVLAYAGMQLGMRRGHVLEEYLYEHLKQKVESWRCGILKQEKEIACSLWWQPQKMRQRLESLNRSLTAQDLEFLADEIVGDIEDHILEMAKNGRSVKRGTRNGYSAVRATIGEHRTNTCFLILECKSNSSDIKVLSLKTSAQFGRSTQNRLRSKQRYSNRPPMLRYV